MSCNVPFRGSLSRTFPPTLPQRESLRLQNYTKKMTYARAYVIFLYFFMYVFCLLFYAIGSFCFSIFLCFYICLSPSFTFRRGDDCLILPSVGSIALATLLCSVNTTGNALQISYCQYPLRHIPSATHLSLPQALCQ